MLDLFETDTLCNDQYAYYCWGRYKIVLNEISGFEKPMQFINGLAGLFLSVGNWRNEEEFRAFVTLAHEVVHYLQDMTTGVGHWDFVQRQSATERALSDLRMRTWEFNPKYALDVSVANQQLQEFANASVRNLYPKRQASAQAALANALSKYHEYQPSAVRLFDLDLLLELDAVIGVYCDLSRLHLTSSQFAISNANRHIWWPLDMTSTYQESFVELLHYFALLLTSDAPIDEKTADQALRISCSFIQVFLDIAFAYPPPTYFASRAGDCAHFEPGLRLIRMLRRFQEDGVVETVLAKNKSLDDVVRVTKEYTYPSIVDVYAEWADYFKNSQNSLVDLRRELSELRAKNPHTMAQRNASKFLENDIPLFIQAPDGETHIIATNRLIGDTQGFLYADILKAERDIQLFAVALGVSSNGYVCPFANDFCNAHSSTCREGYKSLQYLPSKGCIVRESLKKHDFMM